MRNKRKRPIKYNIFVFTKIYIIHCVRHENVSSNTMKYDTVLSQTAPYTISHTSVNEILLGYFDKCISQSKIFAFIIFPEKFFY